MNFKFEIYDSEKLLVRGIGTPCGVLELVQDRLSIIDKKVVERMIERKDFDRFLLRKLSKGWIYLYPM